MSDSGTRRGEPFHPRGGTGREAAGSGTSSLVPPGPVKAPGRTGDTAESVRPQKSVRPIPHSRTDERQVKLGTGHGAGRLITLSSKKFKVGKLSCQALLASSR